MPYPTGGVGHAVFGGVQEVDCKCNGKIYCQKDQAKCGKMGNEVPIDGNTN